MFVERATRAADSGSTGSTGGGEQDSRPSTESSSVPSRPPFRDDSMKMCEERPSPVHGRGMFATKAISRGDLILSEYPIVMINKLSPSVQEVAIAYKIIEPERRMQWDCLPETWSLAKKLEIINLARTPGQGTSDCVEPIAQWCQNAFNDNFQNESVLCAGRARFNHDCQPNAAAVLNPVTQKWDVRALTAIEEDKEIFLSYTSLSLPWEGRSETLSSLWNFKCRCELCSQSASGADSARPRVPAEVRRELLFKIEGQLANLPNENGEFLASDHIQLYEQLFKMELGDERMVLDAMLSALVLSKLHLWYRGDDAKAAEYDAKACELAAVLYGTDCELTEEWKLKMVTEDILPKGSIDVVRQAAGEP